VESGGFGEIGRLIDAGAQRVTVDLVEADQVRPDGLDLRRDLSDVNAAGAADRRADVELKYPENGPPTFLAQGGHHTRP